MTRQGIARRDRDATWIALIVAYYLAYWGLRMAFGASLGLDEAQIPLEAGLWRFGYGVNLPLYTWLQNLLFLLGGQGLAMIALLKAATLCATALGLYGLARLAAGPALAGAATVMLFTQPQFGWEAHRALTHSAVAALAVVAILLTGVRLVRAPSPGRFALLGLAVGLGMLTKYNVWLFVPAGLAVALAHEGGRRAVRARGAWLAPAVAAAVFLGPLVWMLTHLPRASGSVEKFDFAGGVSARIAGLLDLVSASLSLLALPAILLAVAWLAGRTGSRDAATVGPAVLRALVATGVVVVALVAAIVLVSGAGTVRDRWLYPLLAPAILAALVAAGARMGRRGVAAMQISGLAVMALILVALPFYNTAGDANRGAPFADAVAALRGEGVGTGSAVVAPQTWVAGNLAHAAPDWRVDDLRFLRGGPEAGTPFLLVVEGGKGELSEAVTKLSSAATLCPDGGSMRIERPYPRSETATLRLAAAWICE